MVRTSSRNSYSKIPFSNRSHPSLSLASALYTDMSFDCINRTMRFLLLSCWLATALAAEETKSSPPPFFLQDPTDSLCLAGEEFKRCSIDTLFYVVGSPGSSLFEYTVANRFLGDGLTSLRFQLQENIRSTNGKQMEPSMKRTMAYVFPRKIAKRIPVRLDLSN